MIAPVLAAALCSAPLEVERAQVPAEPSIRTFTLFTAPVLTALAAGAGLHGYAVAVLHLPFGATFAVGENWGITAELAGSVAPFKPGRLGWSVAASLGPTWLPSRRGVDGWFVTPKLSFQLAELRHPFCPGGCVSTSDPNDGPLDLGRGVSRAFLFGLDAGYQFRGSPVTFALVLGASAGYQYDGEVFVSPVSSTSTDFRGNRFTGRPQGFAFALNLSLVRIGFSR